MHRQGHTSRTALSCDITVGTVTPVSGVHLTAIADLNVPPTHLFASICSATELDRNKLVSDHSLHNLPLDPWQPYQHSSGLATKTTLAKWDTSCLVRWPHHKLWLVVICSVLHRFRTSAPFASLFGLHHHQQHHRNGYGSLRRGLEARHSTLPGQHHPSHQQRQPGLMRGLHQQLYLLCLVSLVLMLRATLPASAFTDSESQPSASSSYNPPVHRDHHRHHPAQKQTEIGLNITRILNAFFDSGYDKRVRPNYAGPPVEVGVTMHIISISSISAVQMDFTSDFYFRQAWRDSRLSFKPRPGIEALFVGAEVSEKIWVPDTFFANEKSAQFHMATTPNTFIRIKANGEVFRSMRLTVTSSCPMNLQYFPMDRQSCTIEVESYGYSMADIQYKWGIDGKGSVVLAQNLELPQFKVNKHRQMQKVEVLSTGNYSRLVCEIEFVRSMGYYLIQIYIPASLIVIISWVSFWLHRNASPARVQLGVTTVLTMTTLMSSTNAAMPKISYIKSIDVFLGTCFVMVFAALLEYATVGYMGKRIAMRKTRTQQIVRLLNEHREKCIAAAAAAAASAKADGKDDTDGYHERPHRNHSGAGQSSLMRTASLYPCLERVDQEDSHSSHKRDFRSSSTAGHACFHQGHYNQQLSQQSSHHQNNRPLERSSSLKSRIFSEMDDQDQVGTGINNFNDDLSVFVPAASSGNSCCATAVGGTSSLYNASTSLHHSASQSPHYHFQPRHSASDPCYQPGKNSSDRTYMPSPAYMMKDHNTLFGVCPSDIDKYSRVVFPVCFLCFNLMYWIIYMHISEFLIDDQGANSTTHTTDDSG